MSRDYSPDKEYFLYLWMFDKESPDVGNPMVNDFSWEHWYKVPIPMGFEY